MDELPLSSGKQKRATDRIRFDLSDISTEDLSCLVTEPIWLSEGTNKEKWLYVFEIRDSRQADRVLEHSFQQETLLNGRLRCQEIKQHLVIIYHQSKEHMSPLLFFPPLTATSQSLHSKLGCSDSHDYFRKCFFGLWGAALVSRAKQSGLVCWCYFYLQDFTGNWNIHLADTLTHTHSLLT